MKSITPAEMIEWFEGKATEFRKIAQTLKATFNSSGQPSVSVAPSESDGQESKPTNVQAIKQILSTFPNGAARHTKISESLKSTPDEVRDLLIGNPNDFEMIGRGWWKVKQ